MMLDGLINDRVENHNQLWVFYGLQGLGKTTLAASFEKPLILDFEKGSNEVRRSKIDVKSIDGDKFESIDDVYKAIESFTKGGHSFKTLVVDSITSLQPFIYKKVNHEKGKYIDDVDYSKNHKKAVEEATNFVKKLISVKNAGFEVVVIGHSKVAPFNDPKEDKPYDRYVIDSYYTDFAQVFVRYADNVGFCRYGLDKISESKTRAKFTSDGVRYIQFDWAPWATDCKKRLKLPSEVVMDEAGLHLKAAIALSQSNPNETEAEVKASITTLLGAVDEKTAMTVQSALHKAGNDLSELKRIKSKLEIIAKG